MKTSKTKQTDIEKIGEDLFNFAIDRDDVNWLMAHLAKEADIKRSSVEYELHMLKIIGVGWSISYYLDNEPLKNRLLERYWNAVYEFSKDLSSTTELFIGQDINYFQTLKDRLDMYVNALAKNPDVSEPAQVIGSAFARTCGNMDDIFTFMTGSKMFISTITRVKEYFEMVIPG